ncbi:50S ribosomal protein L15 [Candidatus Uhrbacteria bacterium]|nr:50S ribosomal protein L15 [Candidatus Uhrbacteria bacterium]
MELTLHTLRATSGSRKPRKRIGRGLGSGHGAFSTRGIKGQRARSGGSHGLLRKGLQPILRQIPKLRGFKSIHIKPFAVNVDVLEKRFSDGEVVNPKTLNQRGILTVSKKGANVRVKILGNGTLTKKLTIEGCELSRTASERITKAGGTIRGAPQKAL